MLLAKLEMVLERTLSDGYISFVTLKKFAGQCISMQVYINAASLYIHQFRSNGDPTHITVTEPGRFPFQL